MWFEFQILSQQIPPTHCEVEILSSKFQIRIQTTTKLSVGMQTANFDINSIQIQCTQHFDYFTMLGNFVLSAYF